MIGTITEIGFSDEIKLSLSYDDIGDIYMVDIDVVYHDEFIFNLFNYEFNSKSDALKCYNKKRDQIVMLYIEH